MTRKRLVSLIAFAVLVFALLGGGLYLRNFIGSQIKKRVQTYFAYSGIHLRLFPPSILFDDLRTVSGTPFFSARRVSVVLPFSSLFKSEKPLTVFVDRPVVKISRLSEGQQAEGRSRPSLALPFAIERGLVRFGEFYFAGRKESFSAKGLNASLSLRGQSLSIRAEAAETSLRLQPERKSLDGEVSLILEARGARWDVKKFVFAGRDVWAKAQGSLSGQPGPEGTLRVSYKAGLDTVAKVLGMPFEWGGRVEGKGTIRTRKRLGLPATSAAAGSRSTESHWKSRAGRSSTRRFEGFSSP
jgi:hypothetical protein